MPLAKALQRRGYEVTVASADTGRSEQVKAEGMRFVEIPFSRSYGNLLAEALTVAKLGRLVLRLKPDLIHLVALKGVGYGSLAARLRPSIPVVNAIAGLGFTFAVADRNRLLQRAVSYLIKLAARRKNSLTILQNPDDLQELVARQLVDSDHAVVIRGSGVDIDRFQAKPLPGGTPIVLFASRLLKDKGIEEFVAASQTLHDRGTEARFVVVGDPDVGNPASVHPERVDEWARSGVVEIWGGRVDMPDVLAQAALVVLPSYREGLPKVLLEAAATARPVITTDVPGCREVVRDGINGSLVPPRDPAALAEAIDQMLRLPESERIAMGLEGRKLVEAEFSIPIVVDRTLAVYDRLLDGAVRS